MLSRLLVKRVLAAGARAAVLSAMLVAPAGAIERRTIGIGNITNVTDRTTESFAVHGYFKTAPIVVGGVRLPVELIDHPIDARYALTGQVEATIVRRGSDSVSFEHEHKVKLWLWVGGKKSADPFSAKCSGSQSLVYDVRSNGIAPCLALLSGQLAAALEKAQ